jgi:hypothetical protein
VVPVKDAGFEEPAAEGGGGCWFRTGTKNAAISRPAGAVPQGGQYLRFAPPAAGAADVELFPEGVRSPGAHADFDLGSRLRARVPLALTDAQARPDPGRQGELDALRAALAAVGGPSETPDVDQRLADVVVAWSVFRHFYPYWTESGVDWDSRLKPELEAARAAESRTAQRDVLKGLVADVRDGHGFVADALDKTERGELPVALAVIEGRLVVTSSGVPSEAPVGAVVTTIDGAPAPDRLAGATSLASGTTQWRQIAAMWPLPKLQPLAVARGVLFDVRGYPGDAGFGILPHLLDAPEADRWMHVAKIVGPFYETAGWQDMGWDVKPASPRIEGKVVFLTDGGAISYAESVMGYVADRKLGTIVGGTTAGTNGNVAGFLTPGGFNVGFTGMRVTRHDGHSPHHLVGVTPDVAVAPTLQGLRAGRDDVLERGLAIARASASEAGGR